MSRVATRSPSWDALYEIAASQEGMFTTRQAEEAGYSPQLLVHHVRGGRVVRVRRGLYRLVHFPAGEHEDLVVAWLWSGMVGVASHQTALLLYDLSDVLPARIHLTLPPDQRKRSDRIPEGMILHYGEVPAADRGWVGAVPVTNVRRTLNDCAVGHLAPDLLRQGALQALRRGLVDRDELGAVERALRPYGGLTE